MPPTSCARGLASPLNATAAAGASRNEIRSSLFSAASKLRLYGPLYKYAAVYSMNLDTPLPRPFFDDGFPPASFLKTFRAEGNLRLACGLRPATAKTASTLDFLHCAATARSELQHGCASKVLSQFDDSHFCNM